MSAVALLHRPSSLVTSTFHPNWFGTAMGTGMVGVMLGEFAGYVPALRPIGTGLWFVDIALFVVFAALLSRRVICYPQSRAELFNQPAQALFLGTIPICFATIVNGCILFGPSLFGTQADDAAYDGWWAEAILAVLCGIFVPYRMFSSHALSLDHMTPLWLLPIVPGIAAAASAGWLAPTLDQAHQHILVIAGTALWSFSLPLALAMLCLFILRLALHKLPPKELGASGWVSVGPLGAGAFAILMLGDDAASATAATPLASIGAPALAIGIFSGLALWGYATWWWAISILSTMHHVKRELPFNMGWWAFILPLGLYDAATLELGEILHARFFTICAAALTLLLVVLWCIVAARTLRSLRPAP